MAETNPERISVRDMDSAIFRQNEDEDTLQEPETDTVVYTWWGKNDTTLNGYPVLLSGEDNEFAYAKTITYKETKRYFAKIGPNGTLANPEGLYSNRDMQKKIGDESAWRWKEVSSSVFRFYVEFLKTQNRAFLNNAEREVF